MQFVIDRTIAAPPEKVFEVSCDFANAPERISGINKVESKA